jgi:predicted transposase YdaD
VEEHLSEEFQFIRRHGDELFRVCGQQGPFALVVEIQLWGDPRMPRRMRAYAALAEEKYNLPVYPLVIYLLPSADVTPIPDCYHSEWMGLVAHQDYHVVRVWQLDAQGVLTDGIVALVPFTPLMRGGANEEVLRSSIVLLRERRAGAEVEAALALFAGFVMEPEQIRRIVRWDMSVLRESPWYKQIFEEEVERGIQQRSSEWLEKGWQQGIRQGIEQGIEQGIQQGMQQGLIQARRQDIVRLLQMRFDLSGARLTAIAEKLTTIENVDRLQDLLIEAMHTPDVETFQSCLDAASKTGSDA